MHLVSFIVRIYHHSRSPECQMFVLPVAVFKILCILPAPSIYLFYMDLTTSSDDSPYSAFVFITEECVRCAVRAGYLNVIQLIFSNKFVSGTLRYTLHYTTA